MYLVKLLKLEHVTRPPERKINQPSLMKNAKMREKILHGQETVFLNIKMMRLDKNSSETALNITKLKPKLKNCIKGKKVKNLTTQQKSNLENFGKR